MASPDADGRVVFRTTGGRAIGVGHLRRCLTLAEELTAHGVSSAFWVDGDAEASAMITAAGYRVDRIDADEPAASLDLVDRRRPSCLVVDSYTIAPSYFGAVHATVGTLVVIDDLADRAIEADVIVNGSANATDLVYRTNRDSLRLFGPRYSLLRPSFRDVPPRPSTREVRRILVTLGGADPAGLMPTVVAAVSEAVPDLYLDVVVGPLFTTGPQLEAQATQSGGRITLHRAPGNLSSLMNASEVAVSAAGQTIYELAACGVPTVAVCLADNQRGQLNALVKMGVVIESADVGGDRSADLGAAVAALAADPARRARMSAAGQRLVDGWGADRVAAVIVDVLSGKTGIQHVSS